MSKIITIFSDFLLSLWERYSFYISLLMGLIFGIFYYFGYIGNIKNTSGNIVTFSSIIIGVNGVFLTLLITLQESPAFERLKKIFPSFQPRLYTSLRTQITYGLIVVTLTIILSLVNFTPSLILASIGVWVWATFFWLMTLGSFYTVRLVTDIIIKTFKIPNRNMRD